MKVVAVSAPKFTAKALSNTSRCTRDKCDGRERVILREIRAGLLKISQLDCGHSFTTTLPPITPAAKLREMTWGENKDKKLFDPFQITTINKTEESGLRFLNLNEMGLGKMVTSVATLMYHPEALPALVVCKSRLRRQWFQHIVQMSEKRDNGRRALGLLPEILEGGNARPSTEIFNVGIVSFDTLWRIVQKIMAVNKEKSKELFENEDVTIESLPEELLKIAASSPFAPYKTIILDEFQMIKNPGAKRTKGVRLLAQDRPHLIGLSGTPTKNSAEEYYVPLNMIDPVTFHSFRRFCDDWVEYYTTTTGAQKALGIKPNRRKAFDEILSKFSIRFTREQALPSLPKVFRQYEYVEMADKVKEAYKKELKGFEEAYLIWESAETAKDKAAAWGAVYDNLMKLKRLVGLAKADWLIQPEGWLEEFLTDTDRKIVVAHHHIEAGLITVTGAEGICKNLGLKAPLHLHGGLSEDKMFNEVQRFTDDPSLRVLILRQLAEGEGLNLQVCGDLLQLERQWNPANEKQVEDRFPRPGSKYEKINVLYPVALGTVDEFLNQTIERKRYAADNTYGEGAKTHWMNTNVMTDVAKMLFDKGLKPWRAA
jgi:SNF2 family DNA or RNA helicase